MPYGIPPERQYRNQAVTPYGLRQDVIVVESVTARNNVDACNAVTGEKVTYDIVMRCKDGLTYEDCEAQIIVTGDITYDSGQFVIPKGNKPTKSFGFTMPNHDINFHILVRENDIVTSDDIAYDQDHFVRNVTQEEKNACAPVVSPVDLSKIDLTSILIGTSLGGVVGVVSGGKSGAITFGLAGGALALAYTYLTSAQQ